MAITINESDKYYISGKIIKIRNSTLIISVTSPFTCEIEFYCKPEHYDILHLPVFSKYDWMDLRDGHPNVTEAAAYYNTKGKCFYKKESGTASEWKSTDFEDIYNDNPSLVKRNPNIIQNQEEYLFFQNRYRSILEKEQSCEFSAYVIRKEDRRSVHSQQVERHPDDYDYFWIYDPDTFHAEKWNTESIDDLVKELRPSRDCLKQLLESYEDDDRKTKKEKWNRRWETIKSTPKRLQNWLAEYDKLMIAVITLVSGAIGVELIKVIISIITALKN